MLICGAWPGQGFQCLSRKGQDDWVNILFEVQAGQLARHFRHGVPSLVALVTEEFCERAGVLGLYADSGGAWC